MACIIRSHPIRPESGHLLTAGFGFDNFVPPGGQSYSGETKIAANFGGGVKMHVERSTA